MSTSRDFDFYLDEAVSRTVADWTRPRAGAALTTTPAFRHHWEAAVALGWTGILDEGDPTAAATLADRELLDAACGAVTALARTGFALPLRQTLVARYAAVTPLPVEAIAVHPTAHGLWQPAATVLVAADGTVSTVGAPQDGGPNTLIDLAGRPYAPVSETPGAVHHRVTECAQLLLLQEILGAAEGAVREARHYVTQRVQFGRPLIAIPAIRTIVGELEVSLRQLRTAVGEARYRSRNGDERSLAFALMTAREVASTVATEVAGTAHQLHGAMGITEEAGLHWCTRLLWADRDEGLATRDWGLDALPADEAELWAFTTSAPEPQSKP